MKLLEYGLAALIAAAVSIVTLLLNRKWKKADDKIAKENETAKELAAIKDILKQHIETDDQRYADDQRGKIILFADELINKPTQLHTQEHFNQILRAITWYEQYCESHPDYENNQAVMSCDYVRKTYAKCQEARSFL